MRHKLLFLCSILIPVNTYAETALLGDVFSEQTPVSFVVSGDFSTAFKKARAGLPDGFIPMPRNKDPFEGEILANNNSSPVQFKVRGNSSLQECAFPKLSLKFLGTRPNDFAGQKKVKIGTHCGESETINGRIGRLRHEKATWREAAAYKVAQAFGIESLRTRATTLTYQFSGSEHSITTRQAFLLEDIDDLAKRLSGTAVKDPETLEGDFTTFISPALKVRIAFFHALIGNWDWRIGPSTEQKNNSFWNCEVVKFPDGSMMPVPADFDLSSFVTANLAKNRSEMVPLTAENYQKHVQHYLGEFLNGLDPNLVSSVKQDILQRKQAIRSAAEDSPMDPDGKANALAHIYAFFTVVQ